MVSSLINNSINHLQLIITRATRLAVVVVSTHIETRHEPRLASVPLPQRSVRPRAVGKIIGLGVSAGNGELNSCGGEELNERLLVNLPVVVTVLLQVVTEPLDGAKNCQ